MKMSNSLYYIICAVLVFGVLIGISLMSKVKTSVKGNILSAVSVAIATLITLYKFDILSDVSLWLLMIMGFIIGLIGAYRVKMIEMPQAVALLNGFGGASSALVGVITLTYFSGLSFFSILTSGLAIGVGMITLTGSLIAAAKLHKIISQKPIILKGHAVYTGTNLLLITLSIIGMPAASEKRGVLLVLSIVCLIVSGLFGIIFAIRVGGADMPITISLLNSLSGVAGSIAGMAIYDPLLVAIGGIVGASGLILTQIMCRAMNRNLSNILLGKTSVTINTALNENKFEPDKADEVNVNNIDSIDFSSVKKVIIVPGYGMALAQAQGLVKTLADKFEEKGAEVKFAIHPVAGRMPGHMNILLAEVDIPYEKLYEMDDINPEFAECDVAIVVGANDVVNPAANTAEGTPIYGMPVLSVEEAKQIIICNYDLKPGYAGVPNPIYSKPNVFLLLGDAKESLKKLINLIESSIACNSAS